MTRDEAIQRVHERLAADKAIMRTDASAVVRAHEIVDGVAALGLIKFEESSSENDLRLKAIEDLWWVAGRTNAGAFPMSAVDALDRAGFQIVRKP